MNRFAMPTRTILTRIVQALLVVAIVAGTAGFVVLQKTVTLSVDGAQRDVTTFAGSVGALLDREGVEVAERDLVSPSLDADLDDGDSVTIRYARLLTLVLDGEEREIWVTARSVDEALDQLGLRSDNAYLSSSRSSAIGRDGLELHVRTLKDVSITVDGEVHELATTAITVGQAIDEAGVELGAQDLVEPATRTVLTDGASLAVMRVTSQEASDVVELAFGTETREDPNEYLGFEEVLQAGQVGTETTNYRIVNVDGVESYRIKVGNTVIAAAQPRIVVVGTQERPVEPPPPPPSNDPPPSDDPPPSNDPPPSEDPDPPAPPVGGGSVWDQLAECESGGNWSINTGNGYYGGLQFSYGTWLAYGGGQYGETANLASREQQIAIAEILHADSGFYPWPSCAAQLGLI